MEYARRKFPTVVILIAVLILFMLVGSTLIALAQTGGGYDLNWHTVDGGGSSVTGGGYTLTGAIGQPDAASASGGGYSLTGGFWVGDSSAGNNTKYIYLPLVLK